MNDQTLFKRIAAISTILSIPLMLSSTYNAGSAVGFDFDLFSESSELIKLGNHPSRQLFWSWFTAGVSFNLMLLPVVLYLKEWLLPQKPSLIRLYTLFGLGYCVIGAFYLIALAFSLPPLMRSYLSASEQHREVLLVVFQTLYDTAHYGVTPFISLFGGIWWLGTGLVMKRERRNLGILMAILGIVSLCVWGERILFFASLAIIEIPFLILVVIWTIWLGIVIWRSDEQRTTSMEPAPVA